MSESKMLTFAKHRDRDGLPTCAAKNGACKLLQSRRMGTIETCAYLGRDLFRRNGDGSIDPHANCPLWSGA